MPSLRLPPLGWGWLTTPIAAVLLGALVYGDIVLLGLSPTLPTTTTSPVQDLPANWQADFERKLAVVTTALEATPLAPQPPKTEPQGSDTLRWLRRDYTVSLPRSEETGTLERLLEPVTSATPGVAASIAETDRGATVRIGIDGLLTHVLTVTWIRHRARVAIVIDDLGNDLLAARELLGLEVPLTLAIMPYRPFTRETAELANHFQREVLLHLPMEPEAGAGADNPPMLRLGASATEVRNGVEAMLATVPYVVGVNNHMGSAFTADRQHIRWVLEVVQAHQLFFLDSRTTPHSAACATAATVGVPCLERSVFLDDTDDPHAIQEQIDSVVTLARTRGDVVAIGHPRPITIAVLRTALPEVRAAGIEIVPVSALLADPSLSDQ